MKKTAFWVVVLAFALWTTSALASPAVDSVWGIKFGSNFDTVNSSLMERGCSVIEDMTAIDRGNSRVTTYRGDFFDRPCDVKVTFKSGSMVEFKFLFKKKEAETSGDVVMFGNYTDLTLKLRSKYGYDRLKESYKGGEVQIWKVGKMEIELACDGRSVTNHTTVLTYRERS